MNYESMSDFEINKAVAVKRGFSVDKEQYEGFCDRDERIVLCHNNFNTPVGFDPCNNPADAWPMIIENKIGIQHFNRGSWQAHCQGDEVAHDKNPLRAAMIVFLMMNES